MKKEQSNEKRKITVGLIFCWIFGVLFFLMGLGLLIQSAYFSGIIVIIGSLLLMPYFEKLISNKLNFEFSTGVRWLIAIVVIIVFFVGAGNSNDGILSGDDLIKCTLETADTICLNAINQGKDAQLLLDNGKITFRFNEDGSLLQENEIVVYKDEEGNIKCKDGTIVQSDYECIEPEALKIMGVLGKEAEISGVKEVKEITYLSKSYDDLELIFGSGSKYTDLQKEDIFNTQYKGEYVKWRGEVVEIDTTFGALTLAVKQKEKQFSFIDEDVTIYMDDSQKSNLLGLNKGQMVTYSGRLNRFSSAHFYLNDGKIIS